jgi:peptide/nickel transport system permease protein
MIRFIIIRLIQTIFALFGLLTLVFILLRLSGDPTYFLISPMATAEEIANVRAKLGLDKPIYIQYALYLKGLMTFEFGFSYTLDKPVTKMIAEKIPNTLRLTIPAFIIGNSLAFFLGIMAAVRRDSIWDNGVKILIVLGISLPNFFLAILLILLLSIKLNLLPPSAAYQEITLVHYILPVGTLAFFLAPIQMRIIRSTMLDVLDSEYIKLARIKGLPERIVIWKHALRNAMITPLTSLGYMLSFLLTGSFVTEIIFAWPGIAYLSMTAFLGRDFMVVQAVVLMLAGVLLVINLIVDILYAVVDPQIRYQRT